MIQKIAITAGIILSLTLPVAAQAITTSVATQQTISGNKVSTTQPIVAYFSSVDNDTSVVYEPDPEGFYRLFLGRSADGHFLVQDYFQETQKPQTDPYWLYDSYGFSSFGLEYVHGPIIGYYKNGKIAFKGTLDEGSYKTAFESFYPTGKVAHRASNISKGFSRDEYFYEDGKKAITYEYDNEGELTSTKVWDNKGKALSSNEAEDIEDIITDKIRLDQ